MTSTFNSAMHTPINITTFNVNGLGIDIKRQSIFNKLKGDNGVMIPQETDSITNIQKKEKGNWGIKSYSHMETLTIKELPYCHAPDSIKRIN